MNRDLASDAQLTEMIEEVGSASPLYRPSSFWDNLNRVNLEMLGTHGLGNFKRTVSQNYFNWLVVGARDNQLGNLLLDWIKHPSIRPFLNSVEYPDLLRTTDGLERRIGARHITTVRLKVE